MAESPKPSPPKPDQPLAGFGFDRQWPWLLMALFTVYFLFSQGGQQVPQSISYSELLTKIDNGEVARVELRGERLNGRYRATAKDDKRAAESFDFYSIVPQQENRSLLDRLGEKNVQIDVKSSQSPVWLQLLVGFIPWLLIFAFFYYSSRALRGRMGGMFEFGKSRARRYERTEDGPGFDQIAGCETAKRDLQEIIDYLKNPERFRALGAHMPRGILMMGPPGTGKTLLARATAVEAGVPFFSISGSEFIEMYVGVGASRVREMFAQARQEAPALIFIDEIDSVGRMRGTGLGGGNDEREQTLNQILAEMDGFNKQEAVVVLAATNRPDVLDSALLRPGRFDRKVILELPQRAARRAILDVHLRKVPLADDVNADAIAAATVGFSGADLANLVNEAALAAAREQRDRVTGADLEGARDRVLLGEKREGLLNEYERRRVACHEAGHALLAWFSPHTDPLERVSIVPRGRALGITEQRAEEDRYTVDEDFLRERLAVLLGGRCAERVVYGNVSSGAADDLKQATQLARRMVAQWGMSKALGPVSFSIGEEHPFLGREITEPRDFSEASAKQLDDEVRGLLLAAETHALALLQEKRTLLERMVVELIERESLDKAAIAKLLGDKPVR
jgi:cell division protease FtsH